MAGRTVGSTVVCQPQPTTWSGVVPVYSNHRSLNQTMAPSACAIQASCGIVLASARNTSSLWRRASAALRRAVTSCTTPVMPSTPSRRAWSA